MVQILEGEVLNTSANRKNIAQLEHGKFENFGDDPGVYIEAICDRFVNDTLIFNFGKNIGKMYVDEMSLMNQPTSGAYLVSQPVGFYVVDEENMGDYIEYTLSRRAVQSKYYEENVRNFKPTDIVRGKISSLQKTAAFVDIGYGMITLLPAKETSVVRIEDMYNFFRIGEIVNVIVKQGVSDESRFIMVSHKELLGTWEDNVKYIEQGETLNAVITSVQPYGAFVMLTANLVGLTNVVSDSQFDLTPGQHASVTIMHINHDNCKIRVRLNSISNTKDYTRKVPKKNYVLDYDFAANNNTWNYNKGALRVNKPVITYFD
jgi:predicted RNA-binding protein with RPS1 domain